MNVLPAPDAPSICEAADRPHWNLPWTACH